MASFSLAGRDLTQANLTGADVRHVDFSGAVLNRANLERVWAQKASFGCVMPQNASPTHCAQLQGASLNNAYLQGASLDGAQLQGASLYRAQLHGASLIGAQLQGAVLASAQLQGATLMFAQLQGAVLEFAQLQGAWLLRARLQGVSFYGAKLQGAALDGAELQGASFGEPKDSMFNAAAGVLDDLGLRNTAQGKRLLDIESAWHKPAQLQGASFVDACVWRADAREAAWKDTEVTHPDTGPKADESHKCDWTAASFAALKQLIAKEVPEGDKKRYAMEQIEPRLDPTKALDDENEMAEFWAAREHVSPTPEVYEESLAKQWQTTGCAAEGAPYVLPALLARLDSDGSPFVGNSPEVPKLVDAFLKEDCAGARGLSEAEIVKLRAIRDRAAPPAPKP